MPLRSVKSFDEDAQPTIQWTRRKRSFLRRIFKRKASGSSGDAQKKLAAEMGALLSGQKKRRSLSWKQHLALVTLLAVAFVAWILPHPLFPAKSVAVTAPNTGLQQTPDIESMVDRKLALIMAAHRLEVEQLKLALAQAKATPVIEYIPEVSALQPPPVQVAEVPPPPPIQQPAEKTKKPAAKKPTPAAQQARRNIVGSTRIVAEKKITDPELLELYRILQK